jgi:hypothetical protein
LSGEVARLVIEVQGAASIDADTLEAQDAKITVAGAAKVAVHAVKTLNVALDGVGQVKYSGSPAVTKKIDGLGTVTPK